MAYPISFALSKLANAICDWNRTETNADAKRIVQAIDQMYGENSAFLVPMENRKENWHPKMVRSMGGYWLLAYTSAEEGLVFGEKINPVPVRKLFHQIARNERIAGLVINPRDPFFLERELILMNWQQSKDARSRCTMKTCLAGYPYACMVKADIGEEGFYDMERQIDGTYIMHVCDHKQLDGENRCVAIHHTVWNALETVREYGLHEIAFDLSGMISSSNEYRDKTMEIICLSTGQWARVRYTYPLQAVLIARDEEEADRIQRSGLLEMSCWTDTLMN